MELPDDFVVVPPDQLCNYSNTEIRSSHCVIFARVPEKENSQGKPCFLCKKTRTAHGAVMMQMRFDGKLGFAGGLIDDNECPVEAVNREMHEEINLDLSSHSVEPKDHMVSFYSKSKDTVHHCYALEVTESDFKIIEERSLNAKDHGGEVLGIIRVPLYTRMDGLTGLPTFLTNSFAGCSYQQLLTALAITKLLPLEEIEAVEKIASKIRNG